MTDFNVSSFANLQKYRPVRTRLSWGLRMQLHTEGRRGDLWRLNNVFCEGRKSVGWMRNASPGGQSRGRAQGVITRALAGEWMTQWGEECRCHPRPEICGNSGALKPPAPSPHHPPPPVIHYLLFLTIDISVIDSGEIVDENINPWNNDQRLKIPN